MCLFRPSRKATISRLITKVLFLNDDYTSFSFVFNELQRHFHKTRGEARDLTLDVHNKGLAVVGTYPYEVAEHKIGLVEEKTPATRGIRSGPRWRGAETPSKSVVFAKMKKN